MGAKEILERVKVAKMLSIYAFQFGAFIEAWLVN